jgi:DNA repair photolyase
LNPCLFPAVPNGADEAPAETPAAPGLHGIARLAASSPRAAEKRGTEYYLLPVRSVLNRCDSPRVPFEWTVNPYRGCEFGCRYCYARYTHEYMELDGADFERKIFAKQDAGALLGRDLDRHIEALTAGEHIAIGTATDPYQPAEREFGVTRAILERLAAREGLSVSITTKSDQVVRDLVLLERLAARSSLAVNITVTTLRPRLARMLEPRAPRPDLRLVALRKLREAGIAAGVFAMPVLPGLTDREADLDGVARAAHDAGGLWFAANVLFLMPTSLRQFLPFLEEKFPRLARHYRRWYERSGYAPEAYRRQMTALVRRLRQKYGLGSRPYAPDAIARAHTAAPPQLSLGLDSAQEENGREPVAPARPVAQPLRVLSCACG